MCKPDAARKLRRFHHAATIWRVSRGLLDPQFTCADERLGQHLRDGGPFLVCHRRTGLPVRENSAFFQNAGLREKLFPAFYPLALLSPLYAAEAPRCVLPSVFSILSRRNSHNSV